MLRRGDRSTIRVLRNLWNGRRANPLGREADNFSKNGFPETLNGKYREEREASFGGPYD